MSIPQILTNDTLQRRVSWAVFAYAYAVYVQYMDIRVKNLTSPVNYINKFLAHDKPKQYCLHILNHLQFWAFLAAILDFSVQFSKYHHKDVNNNMLAPKIFKMVYRIDQYITLFISKTDKRFMTAILDFDIQYCPHLFTDRIGEFPIPIRMKSIPCTLFTSNLAIYI